MLAGIALLPVLAVEASAQTGPIGYWKLDENPASNGTLLADSSGNANAGTLITNNGATNKSVPGRIGQALTFDGAGDYVDIANQANFNFNQQSFTVAAWVKDVTGVGIVASKGGGSEGWCFVISNTGLEVLLKSAGGTNEVDYAIGSQPFNDGNWHHVAAVIAFDTVTAGNNSVLLYVDGVPISGTNAGNGGPPALSSRTVKWGVRDANGTLQFFFPGKLDDARIYNSGLSASQVLALYGATTPTPTVTTTAATGVTASGAVLNGSVNPNGLATNAWFEWGTSPTLATFNTTATQGVGSGTTAQAVTATLSGLSAGTTYYYRAAASSSAGTAKGSIVSFNATATPGLVGYWKLDESPASNGTLLADSSGNANAGTLITNDGATNKSVPGRIGQALTFDGAGDYVDIANQANFNFNQQSFTVAAWVKDVTGVGIVASKGGGSEGWCFVISDTGLEVLLKNSSGTNVVDYAIGSQPFNDGNWHHVAAVIAFDTVTAGNNSVLLYVDGVPISGTNAGNGGPPALSSRTVKWAVRDANGTLQFFFPGKLDDARIYNSGLSASQVLTLYDAAPPPTPTVTTTAATGVTASGAVLNGSVNPNGLATNAWFEWGTSPTLATFNTTATQGVGSGTTAQAVTATLSGLSAGTTYYYRVAASSSAGTSKGSIVSFLTTTTGPLPTVTTTAATGVTASGAVLNGSVNPNGLATNAWFEWGTSPTLATFTATATQAVGAGTTAQPVTAGLSALIAGTTYYYRAAASSSAGTSKGSIVSFSTTAPPPTVTTMAATGVTASGAVLNGSVNPNGLATNAWFEWGTSPTLATFNATATQGVGSGTTPQAVTATLSGLSAGTTYYYRAAASSSAGTSKGSIVSFNATATSGLIGYWKLDESPASNGTLLADSSGIANAGTLITNNGATNKSVPGRIGQALTFDGAGDYVDIANQANFNFNQQSFTVAAWVKDVTGVGIIASKGGGSEGWCFVISDTGLEVLLKNSSGTNVVDYSIGSQPFNDGNWHHVMAVITFDTVTAGNNSVLLYVDGVLTSGTNAGTGGTPALSSRTVKWGVRDANGTLQFFFHGKIDEARIYNFALSPVHVAVGDSITAGSHDGDLSDGKGFEPILSDLLTASKGDLVLVANVGVSGTTSADGAASICFTLTAYPLAKHYLILYGSNDAFIPAVPSGLGLNPGDPGYNGSYKASMQQIITAVRNGDCRGPGLLPAKTPYLAKVPYTTFPGINYSMIQEYNAVIDELVFLNGIPVTPPDFYTYFQMNPGELDDGLHPNAQGYESMADKPNMWFDVLQPID